MFVEAIETMKHNRLFLFFVLAGIIESVYAQRSEYMLEKSWKFTKGEVTGTEGELYFCAKVNKF